MVHDYADLKPTRDVIELEFKMKPEEFDRQFLAWIEAQTKRTVDGFDEWKKTVKKISEFAKEKQWDDVIREGVRVRDLYPEYVEAASVYEFLADAYQAKGEKDKQMAELAALQQNRRAQSGDAKGTRPASVRRRPKKGSRGHAGTSEPDLSQG